MTTIKTKCVYDKPESSDGYRVLIMRKPMMVNPALKEFRKVNGKRHERHLIDLSPSAELLKSWKTGMIKWQKRKKDQKEFVVSVTCHEQRGCQCYLPKPMMEILGNPSRIKFIVKNKRIEIEAGE